MGRWQIFDGEYVPELRVIDYALFELGESILNCKI